MTKPVVLQNRYRAADGSHDFVKDMNISAKWVSFSESGVHESYVLGGSAHVTPSFPLSFETLSPFGLIYRRWWEWFLGTPCLAAWYAFR